MACYFMHACIFRSFQKLFSSALSSAKWETEALRNEINQAVAQDFYAVPPEGHEKATDNFMFRPLFREQGKLGKLGNGLATGADKVGATNAVIIDAGQEAEGDLDVPTNLIETKTIYSKTGVHEADCRGSTNLYRDILKIESIKEEATVSFGADVLAWQTLSLQKHRTGLVGMTAKSIVLAVHSNDQFKLVQEVELGGRPIDFTTFKHWTKDDFQGFVAVSVEQNIVFLRVNHNMTEMEVYWTWTMHKNTSGLFGFTIDSINMLAVLSPSRSSQHSTVVDIYNFQLDNKEFFIQQQIRLDVSTTQLAHLESGSEHFICFPQSNNVRIYSYKYKWFEYYIDIPAVNVQTISTFRMGSQSYLAIGGEAPLILRYHRGSFHSQTILDKSWGTVDFFLAIDARTYRDDLILFVQHKIDFDSHKLTVLDALVWNGDAFDSDLSTPCFIFGVPSDNGLTCVLDRDHETGIYGTAVLRTGEKLQVLVPRFKTAPAMFDIKLELVKTYREQAEEEILQLFSEVNDMFAEERETFHSLKSFYNEIESSETSSTGGSFDQLNAIDLDVGGSEQTEVVLGSQSGADNFTIGQLREFLQTLNETKQLLEQEVQRSKRQGEQKTQYARSMATQNLNVEYINGIPVNELHIGPSKNLRLNGTLVVTNGSIDAQNVERKTETVSAARDADGKDIVQILDLQAGNFEVNVINGIPWNEFIQDIVVLNAQTPVILKQLSVDGVS